MSQAFIRKAVRLLKASIPAPVTPPISPKEPIDIEIPCDVGGLPPLVTWPGDLATQSPLDPEEQVTQAANDAAEEGSTTEVEEIEYYCPDKWLVIIISRHTKHNFGGRWDCTVGTLRMEIWDEEDSGMGTLIFQCKTSERGGPANKNFSGKENDRLGGNYKYYNQFLIMPRDDYGISSHSTGRYKTYGYSKQYLNKPRPGIAVYGKSSGAMDQRVGVLIHAGTSHTWSEGCIVLHKFGEVRDGVYRFEKMSSVNTLLEFIDKIHKFAGSKTLPIGQKINHVRLIIEENFS